MIGFRFTLVTASITISAVTREPRLARIFLTLHKMRESEFRRTKDSNEARGPDANAASRVRVITRHLRCSDKHKCRDPVR